MHMQQPVSVNWAYILAILHEMTSWLPSLKCDIISKIRLRRTMCVYIKNNHVNFHPDPIWNNVALGIFGRVSPNKMRSDMKSIPDPKITQHSAFSMMIYLVEHLSGNHWFASASLATLIITLRVCLSFCQSFCHSFCHSVCPQLWS